MMNLFREWPADRLAVVTELVSESSPAYHCSRYYQIGHLEKRTPFFLKWFKEKKISGDALLSDSNTGDIQVNHTSPSFRSFIRRLYHRSMQLLGLNHFLNRTVLSDSLIEWVKAYNPDVIYHQPFRFADMSLASQLQSSTRLPMVIHIMDDFVNFTNKLNLLYPYWQKKITGQFKNLIDVSALCLSISDSMSKEYEKRYHKTFYAFRNPVDLIKWSQFQKNSWQISGPARIIYTGRLVCPNADSLLRICRAVSSLISKGSNLLLDIYSLDDSRLFSKKIRSLKGISLNRPIPYKEIPSLLNQYDIAVLPIDFNKRGIKYAKYSISTKTSEYMASGIPVVLLTPLGTALDDYGKATRSMLVLNTRSIKQIEERIRELLNNESLRKSLAQNAIATVAEDSNAIDVRKRFLNLINTASSGLTL